MQRPKLKQTLRCAFFDLDNTLYPQSCGLWDEIGNRMNLYMIERLGMDPREVSGRRQEFFEAFGTTLNALRRYHDVDPDEFMNFVHDIPLGRYIQYDAALDRLLGNMKLRKIIFTNADAQHARRVLSRLGVMRHFESIIDIHLLEFINKPDGRSYRKALEFASVRPEECILIEDLLANLLPARKMGMTTVLVGGDSGTDGAHYHIDRITDLVKIADCGLQIGD
jgi:putative hydrolase of the HAD superfamily